MNRAKLERLLKDVRDGKVGIADALESLKNFPLDSLDFATLDTHRSLRQGFPEVIYGEGKSPEQIIAIAKKMLENHENVLVTRLDANKAARIKKALRGAAYDPVSRLLFVKNHEVRIRGIGVIAVVCAGTSDLSVAEEAARTCEYMGNCVARLFDVGVAGIHRLLNRKDELLSANVVIAVAGMEGALPSVIAGLVSRPVVAVPTSVGYGANLNGFTPLLAMLNSCASGVSVVNIDNGFGAGYVASLINRGQDEH